MPVIEVKNLSYAYGPNFVKKVLDEVSLKIEAGKYVSLIGKTGSGKSTLAGNLSLILRPTQGKVLFDGQDVWQNKAFEHRIRTQIGLIFQFAHHQLFAETVEKDISFGPRQLGLNDLEIKNRVSYAAAAVGIDESLFNKSPFELSGGQQKRVAIAGVLAMKPKVLILDEPTVGIDPEGRQQILEIIRNYHDQQGCTTIHVTHNMQDVVSFADDVVVMDGGKVVSYSTVEQTFANVDLLKKLGFAVPQMVEFFFKLKKKGFDVPTNVYDVAGALSVLHNFILRGKEKE